MKLFLTFIRALAAGIAIGIAGAASIFTTAFIDNPSVALLIKATVFSIGLILIVFCKYSLFTGAVASLTDTMSPKEYFITLPVIWVGNFFGATLIAIINTMFASPEIKEVAIRIAENKCNLSIGQMVVLGILCNLLICIGVTESAKTESTLKKLVILFIVVFGFIICSFEHSIANMYYLNFGNLCGNINNALLAKNLIFVTLGNFIGGWIVVLYKELEEENKGL